MAAKVSDGLISPAVIALGAIVSWLSALGLIAAARSANPRVNALTERAVIAVVISIFLTIYVFIAANTEAEFAMLPPEATIRLLRIAVLGLSFIGPAWLVLWATGRLGR
ncbi:MAG TPA: hypothetical protein VI341_13845 [Actinomycetota bacterium]